MPVLGQKVVKLGIQKQFWQPKLQTFLKWFFVLGG
jgi:hypothetical protein